MQEKKQTFLDHLEELRYRILMCLAIALFASIGFYFLVPSFLPRFTNPVGKLVFLSPAEAFTSRLLLAFYGGIFLSSPFILFQLWRFLSEGLYQGEKKSFLFFLISSTILFFSGSFIGYFIVLPIGLRFLMAFGSESLVPMISISRYISFTAAFVLVFGAIFQLPLVILFLTRIGIVTPDYLSAKRREAVLGIFIFAALFTPPDVMTQVLLALPMWLLYEISIIFSRMAFKEKK